MDKMEWRDSALCQHVSPEIFFPEKGANVRQAKRICEGCPVLKECRSYALAHRDLIGVWGGLSDRDRALVRRGALRAG